LYGADELRALDRRAGEVAGLDADELMARAGAGAWRAARARWLRARGVLVLCGPGNNGGDGYVLARLAQADGRTVRLLRIGEPATAGAAQRARAAWQAAGGTEELYDGGALPAADLVVDALLGTGLRRPPDGRVAEAIVAIATARAAGAGVLALDLPSGLSADHGATPGVAVAADLTVSFIADKLGLHTGRGPALRGRLVLDDLGVPEPVFDGVPPRARLLAAAELRDWLPARQRDAHKGDQGRVLVLGGEHGMLGAALLAGRAALRAGAGLVRVATRADHAVALCAAQPELMVHGVESVAELEALLGVSDVLVLGPGLGRGDWGRSLAAAAARFAPRVVDADALNLLAEAPCAQPGAILTPHPGEAGRLLGCSTAEVQADRPAALRALVDRYDCPVLLKGAGSLLWDGQELRCCPYGNPGMASGGMGDVLSGVIGAFRAQSLEAGTALAAAVLVHALAGDSAATLGERGLIADDLIESLRAVVNPQRPG
jgi:yjeF C-terminal region, hydroxyethylthiazole kinase-related/yjeF N-terminal region